MITVKGKRAIFTGKDEKMLKAEAKRLGLSIQTCFSGMMWEYLMREARKGTFKNGKKA